MKRFLVKETSVAQEGNPNFKGEICITYYGKEQKMVAREGNHLPTENFNLIDYMIEDYGYKRECDAKRSWIYKTPQESKFWHSKIEIVEVEWEEE